MKPTRELPNDAALPGLAAIRDRGPMATMPALGMDGPVEVWLVGYSAGKRATLEARSGHRRVAIKVCATDPMPEVRLYAELGERGLARVGPAAAAGEVVRVPPLLAWHPGLRLVATGWLEGCPLNQLVKEGRGERAGELAARWFRRVASLPSSLGSGYGPADFLDRAPGWVDTLVEADPVLGNMAVTVARALMCTPPPVGFPHLVHGTLYARHIIDMGDGPGLIDWDAFGHGPLEFDAGTLLATIWRIQLSNPDAADAVARAERAFYAGTTGLLDARALSWYRAAALLGAAHRLKARSKGNWKARALALLSEAGRSAVVAAA